MKDIGLGYSTAQEVQILSTVYMYYLYCCLAQQQPICDYKIASSTGELLTDFGNLGDSAFR